MGNLRDRLITAIQDYRSSERVMDFDAEDMAEYLMESIDELKELKSPIGCEVRIKDVLSSVSTYIGTGFEEDMTQYTEKEVPITYHEPIVIDFGSSSTTVVNFTALWENIYPYLDYIGTLLGVVGGTIGFGRWLKRKFEHKHPPKELFSFVINSGTWSSLELASKLNITQEEAKNILKGFGYEWDKTARLYKRTDRTYAIINLLKESLKTDN